MKRSPLTTHVLDTAAGHPAAGVPVRLDFEEAPDRWVHLGAGVTGDDGRVVDILAADHVLKPGRYRMHFDTDTYFRHHRIRGFYPCVDVVFDVVEADGHYHLPLLLSPFGYSTYRGS